MGCYATAFPGGLAINPSNAAALAAQWGFAVPDEPGPRRVGDGRGRAPGRHRGAVVERWQLPRRAARARHHPHRARRARRCGCTRTSCSRTRCWSTRARPSCCSRPRPATNKQAAVRPPPPNGGSRSAPSSTGRASARPAASTQIFLDVARRVDPDRAAAIGCETARGDPRGDRARRARRTRGSRRCARPATRSRSAAHGCARAACSRPWTRAARFSVVVPNVVEVPPGKYLLSTRRGKQFNSMVWKDVDPLTGAARDALLLSRGGRGRDRCPAGRRAARAFAARRDARACAPRADAQRQRAGVLPRSERPARAQPARSDLRRPRLQRGRGSGQARA